jgi:hypothetical protein
MQKLITLARHRFCGTARIHFGRSDEEVNKMLTPLIDQRGNGPVIKITKATTNQWKSFTRKIDDGRCKTSLVSSHGFTVCWSDDATNFACNHRFPLVKSLSIETKSDVLKSLIWNS